MKRLVTIGHQWPPTARTSATSKRPRIHYIKNASDTDLQFLDVFKNSYSADIALSDWISRTPPAVAVQHVNVSEATIPQFPKDKPKVMLERS
jgi:oxalate decarboxylase/phosphoglucose isomerase-like protein (cupin superfamily)